MNELKYFIVGDDSVVAWVYEDDKFGRTLVLKEKVSLNEGLQIYEKGNSTPMPKVIDLLSYFQSMICE